MNSGVKRHFADLENPAEFMVIENLVKKEKAAGELISESWIEYFQKGRIYFFSLDLLKAFDSHLV